MTFLEMQNELKARIATAGVSGFWDDTQLKSWLNQSQIRVAKKRAWSVLIKPKKTITQEGQDYYDLPNDYLYGSFIFIKVDNTDYNFIPPVDFISESFDVPKTFTIQGLWFFLKPTPIASGKEICIWYQRRPKKLVNDTDVSELQEDLHEAIVLTALSIALKKARKYNEGNDVLAEAEIIIRECWKMEKRIKRGPSKGKDITDFYPLYR